ncbi:MAG: DUF3108 domain-containing protein [Pseudomonadota bacterium]
MFVKPAIMFSLLLASVSVNAAERLDYLVEYKGLLSGYEWTDVSRGSIVTTRLSDCAGRGGCMVSTVKMSSRGYALLEAIFRIRFHYRSYYQLNHLRTLAFEMREKKYSDKYLPYGYKHSLAVLPVGESRVDYYKLRARGESLPASVKPFVATDHKPATQIRVEGVKHNAAANNALDRMALLQRVRRAPLKSGYRTSFAGTNGKDRLLFRVAVVAAEEVEAAGRSWKTWKVRLDEIEQGEEPLSLHAWISRDSRHIPVLVELDSSFGEARFHLESY